MTDTSTTDALLQTVLALRTARISLAEHKRKHTEPIAIVGVGCRLPGGAEDLESFNEFLRTGGNGIADIPDDRWDIDRYFDTDPDQPGTMLVKRAGVLPDIAGFDAAFFGISPREAAAMDPQQRLLLEVAWEALEHAGLRADQLSESNTGVFFGISANDYAASATDPATIDIYSATGSANSVAPGRLSYFLSAHGPSIAVDTACSSSLVALHLAVQSLRSGECDRAIVGGVNLIATPQHMIEMSKLKALSPQGRSSPFGAGAAGYVRGEGCGVVILERESDAEPQRVLAHVLSTAVNQNGASNGLTAPNGQAQERVLRKALRLAGLGSDDIDYIQAHGAGTSLGDPIEIRALNEVLGHEREHPLVVGSVKANIGHLEAASGIVNLIAAIGVVRDRIAPGTPVPELNEHIDWSRMNMTVPTAPCQLRQNGSVRAGVSAFGFGGTNAHAIISSVEPVSEQTPTPPDTFVLQLSAHNPAALYDLAGRYRDRIAAAEDSAHDICFSAATHRSALEERAVVLANTCTALERGLTALADGRQRAGVLVGRRAADPGALVFVFSGHGGQWPGMGKQLMATSPVFRGAVERCRDAMADHLDVDVAEVLEAGIDLAGRVDAEIPVSFALQIGLVELLRDKGITPDLVIGHSMGELAAAYSCGALDLTQAACIVCERSRVLEQVGGLGGMLSVHTGVDDIHEWLSENGDVLDIAAVNGPAHVIVTGMADRLEQLAKDFLVRGIETSRVRIHTAAHSRHLDDQLSIFAERLGQVIPGPETGVRFVSTVEGRILDARHLHDQYWVRNLRETVRFDSAVNAALAEGAGAFVEIGPNPVLVDTLTKLIGEQRLATATLHRNGHARRDLLELSARLHIHGTAISPSAFAVAGRSVNLPRYPWQHRRYWAESDWQRQAQGQSERQQMIESSVSGDVVLEHTLDTDRSAWLLDHVIGASPVIAGAWFVNLVAALLWKRTGGKPVVLEGITFDRPLPLRPQSRQRVQVVLRGSDFQITGERDEPIAGETGWARYVHGNIGEYAARPQAVTDVDELRSRHLREFSSEEFYLGYSKLGIDYRRTFRTVTHAFTGDTTALVRVRLVDKASRDSADVAPAALLDGCFQAVGLLAADEGLYLPQSIGRFTLLRRLPAEMWAHVRRSVIEHERQISDLDIYDLDGRLLATVEALTAQRVGAAASAEPQIGALEIVWEEHELPQNDSRIGMILVTGSGAVPELVSDLLQERGAHVRRRIDADVAAADLSGVSCVVFAANPSVSAQTFTDLAALQRLTTLLVSAPEDTSPRLYTVTTAAQAVGGTEADPFQSALWGYITALAPEHPELRPTAIDISGPTEHESVVAEVLADDAERHIACRRGRRHLARLTRIDAQTRSHEPIRADGRPFGLVIDDPGRLDTLTLRERDIPEPGPNDVVVRVHAAGLNFADVMRAMGFFLNSPTTPVELGNECTGTVAAVGSAVRTVAVGDRVVCIAVDCFGTHALADADLVFRLPPSLTDAEAAAAPVVYTTAVYSLEHLARPQQGARILIHSASGGTGLACYEVAKQLGLEVFATAGSPAKRQYLRERGIHHVMDSRSLTFAAEVLELTNGEGVDIVVNSLSGAALETNLRALASDGTLLELGKRDIYADGQLPLGQFKKRLTVTAVDIAGLKVERPALYAEVFHDVMERLARGTLPPLPTQIYPLAEAQSVFRHMAAGDQHIGKLVLDTTADADVDILPDTVPHLTTDGCYVVSGGLGGLGIELAHWLVDRGARDIALLGRRAPDARANEAMAAMRARGVTVTALSVDVADADATDTALQHLRSRGIAIRGVFHLAGLLRDGVVANLTWKQFEDVLGPKAFGAWNLHRATEQDTLDYFVMYSSAASVLPAGGQSNYAAANAFLDGLARYRRTRGLPATALSWGSFSDVGMAAGNAVVQRHLQGRGLAAISPAESHQALGAAMTSGQVHTAILAIDTASWYRAHPYAHGVPMFERFRDSAGVDDGIEGILNIREIPAEERSEKLQDILVRHLASVLGLDADEVPRQTPFIDFGLSSLALLEFKNGLGAALGIELPAAVHWNYPTVDALHGYLVTMLDQEPTALISAESNQ
ncbi:type I polyketide synthase [Mycobacterium haemophilum]